METSYKIEKGIPYPALRRSSRRFPLHLMDINDSFSVEVGKEEGTAKNIIGKIHSAIRYGKSVNKINKNWNYSIRNIDNKYVRCWRIK